MHFLSGFGVTVTGLTSGFAAVLLGLVAVLAALVLWVELIVRSSLVYLLIAISPLGFAATLWPAAKGMLRRTIELLVAVIVSKFFIAVALSIGVAALSGAGTAQPDASLGDQTASGLGTLLIGAVLLGLAAFAPFLVLRLIPLAEAAVVAHGISRGPMRAATSGAATMNTARHLTRISGDGHSAYRAGQASGGAGVGAASAPAAAASAGAVVGRAATERVRSSATAAPNAAGARRPAAEARQPLAPPERRSQP
jgi:hypothetical protein